MSGNLNEEDWDIIADDIPVAFFSIELRRETAYIANNVSAATRSLRGARPRKDEGRSQRIRQNWGRRILRNPIIENFKNNYGHWRLEHAQRVPECARDRSDGFSRGILGLLTIFDLQPARVIVSQK